MIARRGALDAWLNSHRGVFRLDDCFTLLRLDCGLSRRQVEVAVNVLVDAGRARIERQDCSLYLISTGHGTPLVKP